MANPAQVEALCQGLIQRWSNLELTLHFHNTRGMGLANVITGLAAGIDRYDSSLAGLGGCPYAPGATGNVCTEDLVHMLARMGLRTGVDLEGRKSVVQGKSVSVRVDLGGRRISKKKQK